MGNTQSVPEAISREAAGGAGDSVSSVAGATTKESVPKGSEASQLEEKEGKDPDFDQCGLDPDPDELWEDDDPAPRIKESSLTPEEKAMCLGYLDKIFHPDAIKGIRVEFPPEDVIDICNMVVPYLKSEPMLIEDVPFDITIVADLHGQLYDLHRVFKGDERDGKPGWENMKYLFLGDYVDRGRQSLEIVMALYCIKVLYPDRIFLLRGNHEYFSTNMKHGFILDFVDRYDKVTCNMLFVKVNASFCWLSAAAIVGNSYFCAHGGISPAAFTRRQLININKPILESRKDLLIHDLHCTTYNGTRLASVFFGLDELAFALYNMECTTLFRGHTMLEHGFALIGGICVSLFTATGTKNASCIIIFYNDGAVAFLNAEGKLTIRVLECCPERVAWVKRLKRRDGDSTADDEITTDDDDDSGDGKIPTFNNK